MVHNGIEYGMMAAFAEGLNILDKADVGIEAAEHSAEVAPMEEPEFYQFDIDTAKVTELWRRGSVVSSWLLDLTAAALQENPKLDGLAGRVSDSGEGRWTVKAAVDIGVPAPVLAASLFERFASRDEDKFANQVLSAMRQQFGGHKELPAGLELEAGAEKADKVAGHAGQQLSLTHKVSDLRRVVAARSLTIFRRKGVRCSSTICSWPTSGPTPASTSRWAPGWRSSSGPTGRARPTWSRPSGTCPPSARTGSPPTSRWSGPAPSGRSSGPGCRPGWTTRGSCSSRWRSPPARPTGPGSTAPR